MQHKKGKASEKSLLESVTEGGQGGKCWGKISGTLHKITLLTGVEAERYDYYHKGIRGEFTRQVAGASEQKSTISRKKKMLEKVKRVGGGWVRGVWKSFI